LSLVHTNAPEKAEALRLAALPCFPEGIKPYTADVTPVIGSHIGPGGVGFIAVKASANN
jgi:fatty acid-binding protein DegV